MEAVNKGPYKAIEEVRAALADYGEALESWRMKALRNLNGVGKKLEDRTWQDALGTMHKSIRIMQKHKNNRYITPSIRESIAAMDENLIGLYAVTRALNYGNSKVVKAETTNNILAPLLLSAVNRRQEAEQAITAAHEIALITEINETFFNMHDHLRQILDTLKKSPIEYQKLPLAVKGFRESGNYAVKLMEESDQILDYPSGWDNVKFKGRLAEVNDALRITHPPDPDQVWSARLKCERLMKDLREISKRLEFDLHSGGGMAGKGNAISNIFNKGSKELGRTL